MLTWEYHRFLYNNSLQQYCTILLHNSSSRHFSTTFFTQQYFAILLHSSSSQYFSSMFFTQQYFTILLYNNNSSQQYSTIFLHNNTPQYFSTMIFHNTSPPQFFTILLPQCILQCNSTASNHTSIISNNAISIYQHNTSDQRLNCYSASLNSHTRLYVFETAFSASLSIRSSQSKHQYFCRLSGDTDEFLVSIHLR